MIKQTDLRISNLVYDEFGDVRVVVGLPRDCVEFHCGINDMYKNLNGIPITEEWLLKFGFDKKELYGWKGNGADWQPETSKTEVQDYVIDAGDEDFFFLRYTTSYWRKSELDEWNRDIYQTVHKGSWYEKADGDISSKELKYVHQLQNLYFALTGEELTVNL